MDTYVRRDGINGSVWTVLNSQGRVMINTTSLERAVDYSIWRQTSHKRAEVYGWRYIMQNRWYAVRPR